MAYTRKELEKVLPVDTVSCESDLTYRYKGFTMDWKFLAFHPKFYWQRHIDLTLHACLSGTFERFMKRI